MTTYKIDTMFSAEDVQRLHETNTKIVLANPIEGEKPNVSWLTFQPFQANSTTWTEEYGIYASNTVITHGVEIKSISKVAIPAAVGKLYEFQSDGAFSGPLPGGTPNEFSAQNNCDNLPQGYFTFGLYKNAVVNGTAIEGNAISADKVLYKSTISMKPSTTVYLWTQSGGNENIILTSITSPMTKVDFSGSQTEVSLTYDAKTGTFVIDAAAAPQMEIEHIFPE